jgi:hypothetical protein
MYNYGKTGNANHKAIGDMALIAFYYLLRVGECMREGNKCTRTQQFRVQDITLWNNNTILDKTLPLSTLLNQCTAATMNIDNQKNGKRNQSVQHEAIQGNTCPVKALIRRLHHISSNNSAGHTIISTYFTQNKLGKVLRAAQFRAQKIEKGCPCRFATTRVVYTRCLCLRRVKFMVCVHQLRSLV